MMRLAFAVAAVLLAVSATGGHAATGIVDTINCTLHQGHLCVADSCRNVQKANQVTIDVPNRTFKNCYLYDSEWKCSTVPVDIDVQDFVIFGITTVSRDIGIKTFYLSRANGKITVHDGAVSGHTATVDFGFCDIESIKKYR
ncbi:hypothetical protein [Aestuariivirga sp.]|uniref:hypothetical protein n=1 Tax=Aestuariivirga sp. TaxID=2650926 RepID=UPI0035942701